MVSSDMSPRTTTMLSIVNILNRPSQINSHEINRVIIILHHMEGLWEDLEIKVLKEEVTRKRHPLLRPPTQLIVKE